MKLYNTLTREIEDIKPLNAPEVTVYTCGPTVYDYPHVGNWFTFIRYDVLIRALRANGLKPKWVMNITDVGHLVSDADDGEDKLEKGARREGKTAWDVAKRYGNYFVAGLGRLHISQPDFLPKATDHIQEQIELVKTLEAKGYTYTIQDGVYYDTSKFPGYAHFAKLDLDDLQAGARVEHNPEKRNISDFALWKLTPAGINRDMEWDSPWGKGFPGWHLECSAMSMKYLGETIDIHSGGIDHVPVHHTNEIAQSEAATGKRFANYWMHTNHISVNGEKISKSLGNGITLEDIEAKGFSLEAFRLHVLESHYRSQSKFSWESLQAAQNRLNDLKAMAALQWQTVPTVHDQTTFTYSDVGNEIARILSEDLHTETALALLSELTKQVLMIGVANREKDEFVAMLQAIDALLGTQLGNIRDISGEHKQLVAQRQRSREINDWAKADEYRDQLVAADIGLRDGSDGTTTWFPLA